MSFALRSEAAVVKWTNGGSAKAAGDGVLIGSVVGVAETAIAASATGAVRLTGVVRVTKATGAGLGWAQGDKIYWDDTAGEFTDVSAANTFAGVAAVANGDNDTTGDLVLNVGVQA